MANTLQELRAMREVCMPRILWNVMLIKIYIRQYTIQFSKDLKLRMCLSAVCAYVLEHAVQ